MTRLLLIALVILFSTPAAARDSARRRRSRTVVLPTQVLYGRVHTPAAEYILARRRPVFEPLEPRTSFVGEVIGSVRRLP
jgi:hypothetical protein